MERKASPKLRNVLLVDDDPISLQIISILLSSENYSVTEADSGEGAISLLRSALTGGLEVLRLLHAWSGPGWPAPSASFPRRGLGLSP